MVAFGTCAGLQVALWDSVLLHIAADQSMTCSCTDRRFIVVDMACTHSLWKDGGTFQRLHRASNFIEAFMRRCATWLQFAAGDAGMSQSDLKLPGVVVPLTAMICTRYTASLPASLAGDLVCLLHRMKPHLMQESLLAASCYCDQCPLRCNSTARCDSGAVLLEPALIIHVRRNNTNTAS